MGRQHAVRQASRQFRHRTSQQRTVVQPRATSEQKLANQRRKILSPKSNSFFQDESNRLLFAVRLIQRNPWLLWVVALSILVGSATAAITTILDPDASVSYSPGIAVVSSPPAETNRLEGLPAPTSSRPASPVNAAHSGTDAVTPLKPLRSRSNQPKPSASPQSAVGAIALSCAAGCFLLSQWLKPRSTRRRVLFESHSSSQPKRIQHSDGLQAEKRSAETVTPIIAPAISFDLNPAVSQSPELPVEAVEVTVLPAEQSHPLDWNEPSLADSLDLRQRRPLSYWL